MISSETINSKIQQLPLSSQREVLDFIDALLEKSSETGQQEKASMWERWISGNSDNLAIVNDDRLSIYGDD